MPTAYLRYFRPGDSASTDFDLVNFIREREKERLSWEELRDASHYAGGNVPEDPREVYNQAFLAVKISCPVQMAARRRQPWPLSD